MNHNQITNINAYPTACHDRNSDIQRIQNDAIDSAEFVTSILKNYRGSCVSENGAKLLKKLIKVLSDENPKAAQEAYNQIV